MTQDSTRSPTSALMKDALEMPERVAFRRASSTADPADVVAKHICVQQGLQPFGGYNHSSAIKEFMDSPLRSPFPSCHHNIGAHHQDYFSQQDFGPSRSPMTSTPMTSLQPRASDRPMAPVPQYRSSSTSSFLRSAASLTSWYNTSACSVLV